MNIGKTHATQYHLQSGIINRTLFNILSVKLPQRTNTNGILNFRCLCSFVHKHPRNKRYSEMIRKDKQEQQETLYDSHSVLSYINPGKT